MAPTCGPSPKALIYEYNRGSSSNGQAPLVWWYFFTFSEIITSSSEFLSVISSVLSSICCWVTKVVPDFLNLTSIYLIRQYRVQSYYICCILRICMAAGTLSTSLKALEILVRYLMLRSSAWFFVTFLHRYTHWIPVIIFTSLMPDVTFGNCHFIWVSPLPL